MALRFNSQRFFNRPFTRIQSHLDSLSVDSKFFSPLTYWQGFAIKSYKSCFRTIKHLFRGSSPSTIFRDIVFIIINSIQRMFRRRSTTNIFKKILKFKPFFTNFNSLTTISRIILHRRIFTASNHSIPSTPFFSSFSFKTFTMSIHSVLFTTWHIRYIITQIGGGYYR